MPSEIDYTHAGNLHTLSGPRLALRMILDGRGWSSVLDVGCGLGTWLRAAIDLGIHDVEGVDGVAIPPGDLLIPVDRFRTRNLTESFDLGRRFDAALCLEVAEHLEERWAPTLVGTLVGHADEILFSAACPGQGGQGHVNCQWPAYWQAHFNRAGFVCNDAVRWRIWSESGVEPWYRQNLFIARRDPDAAGQEARLASVIHPDMIRYFRGDWQERVEDGELPPGWYVSTPIRAGLAKLARAFGRGRR